MIESKPSYPMEQIGVVRCSATEVKDVPSEGLPSSVILDEEYADALVGIEVDDYVYVLTVFHLADWSVHQGSAGTSNVQGAFSIRSSARPNRIGMTLSRVLAVSGTHLELEWLDFVDGTPVIDIKRYNWRWECLPHARRLDRRFIEQQIPTETLATVLERPCRNFHGEQCEAVAAVGQLGATLVHKQSVWLGDPELTIEVKGDHHWAEAAQGLTGASPGNGRMVRREMGDEVEVTVTQGGLTLRASRREGAWHVREVDLSPT